MSYQVIHRRFSSSRWIFGRTEELCAFFPAERIPGASYIWPLLYCRAYLRRTFSLSRGGEGSALLLCDNPFDLFVNGVQVCAGTRRFAGDLSPFLRAGENRVNIRAPQSADPSYFTAALHGVIHTPEGDIFTDDSWEAIVPADFWQNEEPADWQTREPGFGSLVTCPIHPRANKRSLLLRGSFTVKPGLRKAVLYRTSEGVAYSYIDGIPTDRDLLAQGINRKYREYQEYDVTDLLSAEGEHILSFFTGNGWLNSESTSAVSMNRNRVRAELLLTYADGTAETFGTDGNFRCCPSPLTDNDLQLGERYDARLALPGFGTADFDDSALFPVGTEGGEEDFVLRPYPPIRILRRLFPVTRKGTFCDFGENACGSFSVTLRKTRPGQRILFRVCERLDPDGNPMEGTYCPVFFNRDGKSIAPGSMKNMNVYICRGDETEVYAPRFTFNGFRYLWIEGAGSEQIAGIVMEVMGNALPRTGEIGSDYPLAEVLYRNTRRTWESNIMNGPMDCPTREKNYWTGDSQLFCTTACFLSDCSSFLARWTDGGRKMCPGVYGWGDEIYIIPWTLYRFYGDTDLLRVRYPEILAYAEKRNGKLRNGLPYRPNAPFNDHLSPGLKNVSGDFFAGVYHYYMLVTVSRIAGVLGDTDTVSRYTALAEEVKAAFHKRFFDPAARKYEPEGQSGYVLPLALGLVPEELRQEMADRLNDAVLQKGCLDTGYAGTRYLPGILCDYGHADTAFLLLDREDFPSWKDMLGQGLTGISETWAGPRDLHDEGSLSMNHFTLGSVTGFFFEHLAGIRWEDSEPGFTRILLRPTVLPGMGSLTARFRSVQGPISAGWEVRGELCVYRFTVPSPTEVILPDGSRPGFPPGSHECRFPVPPRRGGVCPAPDPTKERKTL